MAYYLCDKNNFKDLIPEVEKKYNKRKNQIKLRNKNNL